MIIAYLVFIKVSNYNSHKQCKANHTAQEHKNVDVDAVGLQ